MDLIFVRSAFTLCGLGGSVGLPLKEAKPRLGASASFCRLVWRSTFDEVWYRVSAKIAASVPAVPNAWLLGYFVEIDLKYAKLLPRHSISSQNCALGLSEDTQLCELRASMLFYTVSASKTGR